MLKKLINLRAFILAFEIAFIFCFFIGIFWNRSGVKEASYDKSHSFYISRGYPIPWAGVSAIEKSVEFPIVKMPFLTKTIPEDRSKWVKIIDLKVFSPLFILAFLAAYFPSFIAVKAAEENRSLRFILIPGYFILLSFCIFFYFLWFPRI